MFPGLAGTTSRLLLHLLLLFIIYIGASTSQKLSDGVCNFIYQDGKEPVCIGVIVPSHIFKRKGFITRVQKSLMQFNRKNTPSYLMENYIFDFELIEMDRWSPIEILTKLTDQIIEKRVNAILFAGSQQYLEDNTASEEYLMRTIDFLGFPLIAWIAGNAGLLQSSATTSALLLTPSIAHQCQMMLTFLRRYDWHAFSIVTSSMAGHQQFINILRDLTDGASERFDIVSVIKISDPYANTQNVMSSIEKLAKAETRVILLYAQGKEAEVILQHAARRGLTGKEYVWFAAKSVLGDMGQQTDMSIFHVPDEFPVGMFGLNFETEKSRNDALEKGIEIIMEGMKALVEDRQANPTKKVWKTFTMSPAYSADNISIYWPSGKLLYEYMHNTSSQTGISFQEDGTLVDPELKLFNIRIGSERKKQWTDIGTWSNKGGLVMDDITWPGDLHTPPKGRPEKYHLKVVTLEEKPYVVKDNPDPKTGTCSPQAKLCRVAPLNETINIVNATTNSSLYQCCSGLCIDLLRMLSKDVGFEFELFEVEDRKWGAFDTNIGDWNGLVKSIMDEKADMVMTSLKITPERNNVIDFSVPFLETGITIIVAVRDGVISPTAFLEPYDYPSWCLILVFSVHASGAAIFIFEWLSPSGLDRGNKPIREHRFSLFRSFWLIWAMLFGAAVNVDNPRGVSSRFLANIWALFAVVFTASYTANLAAFMITKEDYDRLTGIQDWRLMTPRAHKPPFKFATVPHGSTETNLMNNYPKMYEYMKQFNRSTVRDGIKAVKDGEINAFIYDATVLEYLAGHDDGCKLRTVGNWYAMTGYGVGFPKGSKWIEHINKFMIQYQHDGELERLQKFWLAGACREEEEGEASMPLGILNFTSAFILLAGGMLLGGLLLLLEHIYFKFFRARLRKWDKCGCCGLVSLSMGKSLTFEQSVREAIELQRHHKCKNPVCETQQWKLKHELDLALLKIDRLQRQMGLPETAAPVQRAVVKREPRNAVTRPTAVPIAGSLPYRNQSRLSPVWMGKRENGIMPSAKRGVWKQQQGPPHQLHPGSTQPPVGWRPEILGSSHHYYPANPSSMPPPDSWGCQPPTTASAAPPISSSLRRRSPERNKKGSKSLPNSPTKRPSHFVDDRVGGEGSGLFNPEDHFHEETGMPRATSFINPDRKTRVHKGNVYIEVPDSQLEKETVL